MTPPARTASGRSGAQQGPSTDGAAPFRRGGERPPARRRPGSGLVLAALLYAAATWASQEDIPRHRECGYCGMDRKAYGFSRMLVVYQDGGEAGVCSLHCALVELDANPARAVKALRVADRDTRELVDAEAATWVLGGRKRGVMTMRPKWAFASASAAEAFAHSHGGEVVPWARALAAAREDLAQEIAMERTERRARPFGCQACSGRPASPPPPEPEDAGAAPRYPPAP